MIHRIPSFKISTDLVTAYMSQAGPVGQVGFVSRDLGAFAEHNKNQLEVHDYTTTDPARLAG